MVQGGCTLVLRKLAVDLCRDDNGISFLDRRYDYNETNQTNVSILRELKRKVVKIIIRWINSDLVGVTYNMKDIKSETDTRQNDFFEGELYFGWPSQPSTGNKMKILHWTCFYAAYFRIPEIRKTNRQRKLKMI